jgi:hypothetical protein
MLPSIWKNTQRVMKKQDYDYLCQTVAGFWYKALAHLNTVLSTSQTAQKCNDCLKTQEYSQVY